MELSPEAHQDTLVAELHEDSRVLATGTIQVSELQKIASQGDVFGVEDDASAPGFLKALFPCLRRQAGTQSSMAWVKLVDDGGRTAGHAVLSSRAITSLAGGEGFLAPSSQGSGLPLIEEVTALSLEQQHAAAAYESMLAAPPAPTHLATPPTTTTHCVVRVDGGGKATSSAGGYLHVTALQVYDELLAGALRSQGCGPRALALEGPWGWLLQEVAGGYGVRPLYTALSYLRWVVRPDVATVTADCFDVVLRELGPLKAAQHSAALSSGELGVLAQVCARIEELLTACFENYFMLSEDAPSGMMDGALSVRSAIPAVLRPAVAIYAQLRDGGAAPADQDWLAERFCVAARKRYQGLLTATELQRPASPRARHTPDHRGAGPEDAPEAVRAYGRMEELSKAIMNELRADDAIQEVGLLPDFLNLPAITSLQYVKASPGGDGGTGRKCRGRRRDGCLRGQAEAGAGPRPAPERA